MHTPMPRCPRSHCAKALGLRQQGATLVMALLVLVLIMLLGIAALGTSDTQFKLASNLQFDNNASVKGHCSSRR